MVEASYLHSMGRNKSWKRQFLESLLIFIFGMVIVFVYCRECYTDFANHRSVFIFSGILWVVLWKGNELMSDLADHRISWMDRPVPRLFLGLFLHTFYSVFAVIILQVLIHWILYGNLVLDLKTNLNYSVPAVIITLIIALIFTAVRFFLSWRDLAVQHEKLNTEAIASRFAALKNQVNPHFLFNSLNVLTNLVYKDADQSAKFIRKLSEVYRYVLDTQDKEIVPLTEEIAFVQSFVYLQKMRFGKELEVDINVPDKTHFFVLPLSVQMLVENAIKHNGISRNSPLKISIDIDAAHVVVKNNLNPKENIDQKKNRIGLENIKSRYQFLSNGEVMINRDPHYFMVKLPLLTNIDARTDH